VPHLYLYHQPKKVASTNSCILCKEKERKNAGNEEGREFIGLESVWNGRVSHDLSVLCLVLVVVKRQVGS
jgi:hypothetical protein